MSGETAVPTTAGEVLDLSLSASTIHNQSTSNEMLRGQENGGSLPGLSAGAALPPPAGPAICPAGFNRGIDFVDSSWLTLNPFLARSFAQNLSAVQAQLPFGMMNLPFGWPLKLDHMTSTSEEDVIDLSLNNNNNNNSETDIGKTMTVAASTNGSSQPVGLANGNGFLQTGGDSFNAGPAFFGVNPMFFQPPNPPPAPEGLELTTKRSNFDPSAAAAAVTAPLFMGLPTLPSHNLRFELPTSAPELKAFADENFRLPKFPDPSSLALGSVQIPCASKGLLAMSLPDFYAKSAWGYKDCNDILKKCQSYQECGNQSCRMAGNREHFHCLQCEKVIIRREEAIRHLKWHKKREESLQYGFMRYSPSDDCGNSECSYNAKQTHYHCLQPNCSKTYISTSDVQMHANYHRKDAVILKEGFQRYRATEVCDVPNCPYLDERTTHFHCKRTGCNFTFKNKADIEKHKNHHQKNDEHAKNGFRKFTKYEACRFAGCKYSSVMNHIHCIRPGCDYVVHSSSQILSHKRKHERRQMTSMIKLSSGNSSSDCIYDNVFSAKNLSEFRLGLTTTTTTTTTPTSGGNSPNLSQDNPTHPPHPLPPAPLKDAEYTQLRSTPNDSPEDCFGGGDSKASPVSGSATSPAASSVLQAVTRVANACWSQWRYNRLPELRTSNVNGSGEETAAATAAAASELFVKTVLAEVLPSVVPFAAGQSCESTECSFNHTGTAHFHCLRPGCCENSQAASLRAELWEAHWLLHARQSALSRLGFLPCDGGPTCPGQQQQHHQSEELDHHHRPHLHCRLAADCNFVIDAAVFSPALGLRHWASQHDKRFAAGCAPDAIETCKRLATTATTPRKRGRPPKHARGIQVPRPDLPEELCVDETPALISITREMFPAEGSGVRGGMKIYPVSGPPCPDELCQFRGHEHFHCVRPRCHTATASLFVVNSHRVEFHAHTDIEPGYEYFDRSVDCRRASCYNNRVNGHFHCVRARCDYCFVRYSKMAQHSRKHQETENAAAAAVVCCGGFPLRTPFAPTAADFTGSADVRIPSSTGGGGGGGEDTEMPMLQPPTPTMVPPLGVKNLPDLWTTPVSQSQMPSLFFLLTNFFNSQTTNPAAGLGLLPQPTGFAIPPEGEGGLPPANSVTTVTAENEVTSETSSPTNAFPEDSVASEKMEWEEEEEEVGEEEGAQRTTHQPTIRRQSENMIAS